MNVLYKKAGVAISIFDKVDFQNRQNSDKNG